jgi:hypothetical protein
MGTHGNEENENGGDRLVKRTTLNSDSMTTSPLASSDEVYWSAGLFQLTKHFVHRLQCIFAPRKNTRRRAEGTSADRLMSPDK